MSKRVDNITNHLKKNILNESIINGFDEESVAAIGESKVFTEEQIVQYHEKGYIVVKKLLNDKEVQFFRSRFNEIVTKEIEVEGMIRMRDISLATQMKKEGRKEVNGVNEVFKIQDWQNDEELMKYCKNKKIIDHVESLIGSNLISIHTMVINKPSDLGTGSSKHPVHQDLLYFPFRPSNKIVASWTALEKITHENGCLYVSPGSHKGGLFAHERDDSGNSGYVGITEKVTTDTYKKYGKIEVPMEAGDTIFFHPCLFHGSGPNLSKGFRMAISCHYAGGDCLFTNTLPKHNWSILDEVFEVPLRKNLGEKGAKDLINKLPKEVKLKLYSYHWKQKSRQVKGISTGNWSINEKEQTLIDNIRSQRVS